jgi:hypothetical protein
MTTANLKAETNFKKDYMLAKEAQWSVFADKSLMCRFYLNNNILHRAFYTPHGNWTYTMSGYDGSKLNKATADRIKSVYYNFRIVYVDQVDLVSDRTFILSKYRMKNQSVNFGLTTMKSRYYRNLRSHKEGHLQSEWL